MCRNKILNELQTKKSKKDITVVIVEKIEMIDDDEDEEEEDSWTLIARPTKEYEIVDLFTIIIGITIVLIICISACNFYRNSFLDVRISD